MNENILQKSHEGNDPGIARKPLRLKLTEQGGEKMLSESKMGGKKCGCKGVAV